MRKEFYSQLPKNAIVAEIGVMHGANSKVIWETAKPKRMYLIDAWEPSDEYGEYNMEKLYKSVSRAWEKVENVTVVKNYSAPASKKFENHYFDWVYIDASHEYANVKMDLAHWLPKVKKGGFICGHDFTLRDDHKWEGVHGAVIEFMVKYVENKPELIEGLPANWWNQGNKTPEYIYDVLIGSKWWYCTTTNEQRYLPYGKLNWSFHQRSFQIEVGDWADHIDYEQIIKESYED